MSNDPLDMKKEVHDFWNEASCGTGITAQKKYSKAYFEEIERFRYETEPDIFEFAQFTRFYGKKVLEVGVGAGTDFLQWVRAGAEAYGVDLTEEAIKNVEERLKVYNLQSCELRVADAENLPFPEDCFDLVYSWGVIHHSPDMLKALYEIVRVTKPGGLCKIMIYNKYSLQTILMWLKHGLLQGRPFRGISDIYHHHQESIGTRVHSQKEMSGVLKNLPVTDIKMHSHVKPRDINPPINPENRSRLKDLYFLLIRPIACLMDILMLVFILKLSSLKM